MINVDQITSRLAKLPDGALQQYAAMHKNDPYILALAVAESNRRKEMRQAAQGAQAGMEPPKVADQALAEMSSTPLPEDQGIARLPVGDMEFADGGLVAFASGGSSRSGRSAFDAALDAEGVTDPRERAFLKAIHLQESGGRPTAATSNRGARGPMQILPGTFQSVADKGMDIDNPSDNMRAGIRYARQGYRAAGGDPVLAGAYYYGGPGGLEKARRGVAVPDPKNPKAPDTIGYGTSVAKRMTALLPIGTAYAEPAPAAAPAAPALTREQLIAQIPGQDGRPVQAQPTPEPNKSVLDYLTAPFVTARTLAQNTLAIPAAPILSGLSQLRPQGGMSVEEAYRALQSSPSNPVARDVLEGAARVAEDLKLPPYIPSLTPVRGPKAATAAETAAVAKAEAPRLGYTQPRLAPPTPQLAGVSPEAQGIMRVHPDRLAALEKARLATQQADEAAALARQEANLARDKAAAAAAQGRITDANTGIAAARAINEALPGQTARAGLAGLVGNVAQTTADLPAPQEAAPTDDGSYERLEQKRLREKSFGLADLKPEAKQDIVEAAKEVTPDKKGRGFTGEDWLMLGLNLMASKSPRFMNALGEAGLGAMKARQERVKEAREQESASVMDAYRKALGEQATAQADVLKSGNTKTKLALEAANTMYDNWLNTMKANPMNAMGIDPAVANEKYNQMLRQAFSSFNIPVPPSLLTGGATQYSPADLALVERYAGKN